MLAYKAFYIWVFENKKVFGIYKSGFYHLKVYGYKTYIFIKFKLDAQY